MFSPSYTYLFTHKPYKPTVYIENTYAPKNSNQEFLMDGFIFKQLSSLSTGYSFYSSLYPAYRFKTM